MNKIILSLLLTIFTTTWCLAINGFQYDWEKDRKRYPLTEEEQAMTELVLKHHTEYHYALEDNQFVMYTTTHKVVLVNNSEAVQKWNRISIPMYSTIDLVEVKARVIGKDGKVVNFDKNNLKELKDDERGSAFRVFAMEGVTLGSEIEFFFVKKMNGNVFSNVLLQADVLTKNSSFKLTSPPHLKFDFKSYYGYADVKFEEVKDGDTVLENVYTANMATVPPLKEETYAYFDAIRMRIEFKLAYNTARSQARLYTWDEAAKTFYAMLYNNYSKDDVKALEKFVKSLDDKPTQSIDTRIKSIEQKIKTGIQVDENARGENTGVLASVIKYKVASKEGITRLYAAVFEKLSINCQPVITCSRERGKFDGDFDTWSYLDEYILYFPDTKGFLAPFSFETRYPLVPPDFTAQNGLFMEPIEIGGIKSALGSIDLIPAVPYDVSCDDLSVEASFNDDMSVNTIHQVREFGGYNAVFFAPYYDLMTEEQRLKMVEELTKQTAPDAVIKKWDGKPLPEKKAGNFVFDVSFETNHFIEKAGPRILFKVGELIGPQVEMYRDDKRVADIENEYNRGYERLIKINIPKGYTIKNPKDLKMDISFEDGNEKPFLFESDYELKDGLLTIKIKEYYKEIFVPVAKYEDFRKVINAAADFNKVTLILEKSK
jgi:hypothetical protein